MAVRKCLRSTVGGTRFRRSKKVGKWNVFLTSITGMAGSVMMERA
jgi:hypothetical protein